jgi:uncharacterized protein YoxC
MAKKIKVKDQREEQLKEKEDVLIKLIKADLETLRVVMANIKQLGDAIKDLADVQADTIRLVGDIARSIGQINCNG